MKIKLTCNKITTLDIVLLIYFVSIFLQISLIHYICMAYFLICLVKDLFYKGIGRVSFYVAWITAFVTYTLMSAFWSNYFFDALNNSKGMIEFIIVGSYLYSYYMRTDNIDKVLLMFVIAGLIFAFVLLIQVPVSQWGGRLANANYAANANATKLMESSLCAIGLYKIKNSRLIYLGIWGLFFVFIILTGSRTMLVGTVVGILIVFFLDVDKKNLLKPMIFIIAIIAIMFITYDYIMTNPTLYNAIGYRMELLINSVFGTGRIYNSDRVRFQLIEEGIELFKERPIFGWGSFMFSRESASGAYYAHNNYVEILADFGLIGFIIYYSLFLFYGIRAFRIRARGKNYYLSFSIAVILSFLVVDYGTVSWYRENVHILFMVFPAVIDRVAYQKKIRMVDRKHGCIQ